MITSGRASFVKTRNESLWLPAQVTKACRAYNEWRHDGAIKWPHVRAEDLLTLLVVNPDMKDPILLPCLAYIDNTGKINDFMKDSKEPKPNTRQARKISVAAATCLPQQQ
jgi:hypothetical protein